VTRGTSPVTSTEPSSTKLGWLPSRMSNPASVSARGLTLGISIGSMPGSTVRRRRQKWGCSRIGMFTRPTARIRPSMPVVWSKWPWLHTMASIEPRSMASRRRFSVTPSGLVPASKSSRWLRAPRWTVTSMEKPCSASSASGAWPPAMTAHGRACRSGPGRRAGPWSGMKMSVTLSITETISTASTGARPMGSAGPASCRTGGSGAGGLLSVHMAAPAVTAHVRVDGVPPTQS